MVSTTQQSTLFQPSARVARAHAMKNCITIIFALSRLAEREVGVDSRERWGHLRAAAQRLRQLLAEEIAEETSDSGPVRQSRLESFDVDTLVASVARRLKLRAAEAGVELSVFCGGGSVMGDAVGLGEALFNIVANAIEATPRGGWVSLETRQLASGDQQWLLRDTGNGFPMRGVDPLGHRRSSKEGGSGVGLALARAAIGRQGGALRIESDPSSGTTMTIVLPKHGQGEVQ